MNKKEFIETVDFLRTNIQNFRPVLTNRNGLKGVFGNAAKKIIQDHYLYRKITEDMKLKKRVIKALAAYFPKSDIDIILRNLE